MKYALESPAFFLLEQKLKIEKNVYCHFHGDASTSITCRKNIGADSFWSAGNVFEGLTHKILPVDRLIANLFSRTKLRCV
jgi:hypothetical protein